MTYNKETTGNPAAIWLFNALKQRRDAVKKMEQQDRIHAESVRIVYEASRLKSKYPILDLERWI